MEILIHTHLIVPPLLPCFIFLHQTVAAPLTGLAPEAVSDDLAPVSGLRIAGLPAYNGYAGLNGFGYNGLGLGLNGWAGAGAGYYGNYGNYGLNRLNYGAYPGYGGYGGYHGGYGQPYYG